MATYAETLLSIKDHIAAYQMLASEEVNKKLEELRKLKDEVDAKAAAVATADAIEQLKKDADAYVAEQYAATQAEWKKLDGGWDDLHRAKADLDANIEALQADQSAFTEAKRAREAEYAHKVASVDQALAALEEQKQAAAEAQKAADAQYELYAAKVKDFDARIAAIQKVVS